MMEKYKKERVLRRKNRKREKLKKDQIDNIISIQPLRWSEPTVVKATQPRAYRNSI